MDLTKCSRRKAAAFKLFVDRMSWHLLISDKSMDLIACTEIGAGD